MATLIFAVVLFFAMSFVTSPLQLGVLRFLLACRWCDVTRGANIAGEIFQ